MKPKVSKQVCNINTYDGNALKIVTWKCHTVLYICMFLMLTHSKSSEYLGDWNLHKSVLDSSVEFSILMAIVFWVGFFVVLLWLVEWRDIINVLKLLSKPWWILIPNIKTNKNRQQYFTHNHYQKHTSLNFIVVVRQMWNKYARHLVLEGFLGL